MAGEAAPGGKPTETPDRNAPTQDPNPLRRIDAVFDALAAYGQGGGAAEPEGVGAEGEPASDHSQCGKYGLLSSMMALIASDCA